ncbi:fimbrial protein [Cronobacter dublinensis]
MKRFIFLIAPLLTLALLKQAQAEDNVHFSGALIATSCTLPDSDKDININFGVIVEKYLYKYQRTKSQHLPYTCKIVIPRWPVRLMLPLKVRQTVS